MCLFYPCARFKIFINRDYDSTQQLRKKTRLTVSDNSKKSYTKFIKCSVNIDLKNLILLSTKIFFFKLKSIFFNFIYRFFTRFTIAQYYKSTTWLSIQSFLNLWFKSFACFWYYTEPWHMTMKHWFLEILIRVWSPKLSNAEHGLYRDGWPLGNTGFCRLGFVDNNTEQEIGQSILNSSRVHNIYLLANTLGKIYESISSSQVMG